MSMETGYSGLEESAQFLTATAELFCGAQYVGRDDDTMANGTLLLTKWRQCLGPEGPYYFLHLLLRGLVFVTLL